MNAKLLVAAGILCTASAIHGVSLALTPTSIGLFVAGWALTLLAPRTPVGSFPSAAVFFLLLVQLVTPFAATIGTVVGFLLTIALRGGGGDLEAELRLGTLPPLVTSAVASLALVGQPLPLMVAATSFVYLLALNLCAGWQAQKGQRLPVPWAELRWAFLRSSTVLPLLAAMGTVLIPQHPAWILCLAVVAWFGASAAVTELVRSQLKPMSGQLKHTREREQRWVTRLKVLETLSKRMTRASDVDTAVQGIVATVKEYCERDEVAVHLSPPPARARFPLADVGWLEVGGEVSEEESGLLTALATTAGFALKMVQGRQARLESVTGERDRMEEWLARLRVLLEASQSTASSLSIDSVLDATGPVLRKLVPQARHAVASLQPASRRGGSGMPPLEPIVERVARGESGLLEPGLLALPILFEGRPRGVLISAAESFDSLDQELLRILAYQLGGAFERARLYQGIRAAESQVVQASKMAAVGQLAAGVAHELNTPLGTVLMGVEYAEEALEAQPEQARKRLGLARRAGEKARAIIAKLLHYSREATLEDQSVNLEKVVQDAVELLAYHLDRSGVTLDLQLSPCAAVKGNENELHQVLSNLVLNSRDALLSGDFPKTVIIRLWQEGERARLSVTDHGPGIPTAVLPRIFEPFFTTRAVGDGTGLGLSVSQQIVEKHRGTLEVASRPGETAFTMTLPLA